MECISCAFLVCCLFKWTNWQRNISLYCTTSTHILLESYLHHCSRTWTALIYLMQLCPNSKQKKMGENLFWFALPFQEFTHVPKYFLEHSWVILVFYINMGLSQFLELRPEVLATSKIKIWNNLSNIREGWTWKVCVYVYILKTWPIVPTIRPPQIPCLHGIQLMLIIGILESWIFYFQEHPCI